MTGRLKSMDEENEIESDWKFAAMVIDRFGLNLIWTYKHKHKHNESDRKFFLACLKFDSHRQRLLTGSV